MHFALITITKKKFVFNFRNEKAHIKLPLDIEDAKNLGRVLDRYKDKYFIEVLALVFVTYILYPFIINLCMRIFRNVI